MTKEELINKAVYIQYPLTYTSYKNYDVGKKIHKLPLAEKGFMYDGWKYNENHFTTKYHRKYSLPLLAKVLNFEYNENDFTLIERKSDDFDISMLCPKHKYEYEIYGFNHNEYFDNITYNDLINCPFNKDGITNYHKLYKYPHENSRIINKTVNNSRILFISGDSQMIPDLSVLSCYFKEIWYFDNRDEIALMDKWKNVIFTDVLVEMNNNIQTQYLDLNFK